MEEKSINIPEKKDQPEKKIQKKVLVITNSTKQLRIISYIDNSGKENTIKFSDSIEVTESKDLLSKLETLVRRSKVTYKTV